MDNPKEIAVSLAIGDRTYRVRVPVLEEEQIRKTVRFINEKITEYKNNIVGKDMQDYVSMALVWYATLPQGEIQNLLANSETEAELNRLETLLDKALGVG